jgi:hypothetical protein
VLPRVMKFCGRCDNCRWLCEAHPLMLVGRERRPNDDSADWRHADAAPPNKPTA